MGHFVEINPSPSGADLAEKYRIPKPSEPAGARCEHADESGRGCQRRASLRPDRSGGKRCPFHHSDSSGAFGKDAVFDRIMGNVAQAPGEIEEQSSVYYDYHTWQYLKDQQNGIDTIVQAGCDPGGMAPVFAQFAGALDCTLVLVEPRLGRLLYAYERIARTAPEAVERVGLYHGEFSDFAREFRKPLCQRSIYLALDCPHDYEGVLADMKAAHGIREGLHSIACRNFDRRSADFRVDLFVDRALFSVFGLDAAFRYIGYNSGDCAGASADRSAAGPFYSKPNCFEGVIVNLAENGFCYDSLPFRPALRQILAHCARRTRQWLRLKRKKADPAVRRAFLYRLETPTGIRTQSGIESGETEGETLAVRAGESMDAMPMGRVFLEYDGGRGFREAAGGESLRFRVEDARICAAEGRNLIGRRPGKTSARLQCGSLEKEVAIVVTEETPWVWTDGIPAHDFFVETKKRASPRVMEIGSRNVTDLMPRYHLPEDGTVVGVDIEPGENVDVVCDAHDLRSRFEANSFDGVYSNSVFEHVAMPWKAALEINHALKPGGVAYVGTVHTFPLHHMPWDFWRYGRDALPALFRKELGFEIVSHCVQLPGTLRAPGAGGKRVVDRLYLFTSILVRKVFDYDPSRFRWALSLDEALPGDHRYPEAVGKLSRAGDAAAKPRGGEYGTTTDDLGAVLSTLIETGLSIGEGANGLLLVFNPEKSGWQNKELLTLLRGSGGVETERRRAGLALREYATVEEAKAIYDLSREFGRGAFDFILALDVLRLLEFPWRAAVTLSELLRPGGRIVLRDSSTRPIDIEPDLFRFTSEGFRVLFNPCLGFRMEKSLVGDPWLLHPNQDVLSAYDPQCPCYGASLASAVKVAEPDESRFCWDVGK